MKWHCDEVEVKGTLLGEDGKEMTETLELWRRDPVECIRELIGNPAFRDTMRFAPERLYADEEGNVRVFEEMWTGDWWWKTQVRHSVRVPAERRV